MFYLLYECNFIPRLLYPLTSKVPPRPTPMFLPKLPTKLSPRLSPSPPQRMNPWLHLSLPPRMTPRFTPRKNQIITPKDFQFFSNKADFMVTPMLSLCQSPLKLQQNTQYQFKLLVLLLVCDFIYFVLFVLSTCFIFCMNVILYQDCHLNFPLKLPKGCP